ncbi:MAG: HAD hydrolase-like protein [Chitinophagales bacterium]
MEIYEHIIWDWNGTLLNDVDLCVAIVNEMLTAHHEELLEEITNEHYRSIFDFPVIQYYERVGFDFTKESFDDLCVKFIGSYHSKALELQLHHEVRDVLSYIAALGFQQSILSAAKQEGLRQMVRQHQIDHFFQHIMGEDDHYAHGKVQNARRLRDTLKGVADHKLLLIGDTTHDFEVAQAIEADCILIAHGHHSHQKLQKTGAKVVNSLGELMSHLRFPTK